MKILLHSCCGPCSIYPVKKVRELGYEVMGYFYNPNIHPYTEWKQRRDTLKSFAESIDFKLIIHDEYELDEFLRGVVHRESKRCQTCYHIRLRKTAQVAKAGNFDAFSTTLLISPFQDHNLIKEIGEAIGVEIGIPFYYYDFREGFKESVEVSKVEGMYRQQYCGCIYSEKERYYRPKKGAKK
jgi:epoxyqueuosine reductase